MSTSKRITPANFKLYGVFGFPLKHTLSPAMHQAALEKLRVPGFYMALELAPKNFKKLMVQRNLLLDGFNLTVPHKQIVIPFLDSVSREAKLIGAVNTVIRKNGRLLGENTDAYGFMKLLRAELGWKSKGKTVLILGAGGASRACIYALCADGAKEIIVLNRTVAKARTLVSVFKRQFPRVRFQARALVSREVRNALLEAGLVVNTTSVGLKPSDNPVVKKGDFPRAKGNRFAVDLIYNPPQTPFLRLARSAGWKTANGLGMLLHQGARAFELWTGKKAPVEVMKRALVVATSVAKK